jgi:hypothetical protein
MFGSWWFWWVAFMFIFLMPPLGYGWGYRGWGPPYPRYIQRRRMQRATSSGGPGPINHQAWGWGGDFVWVMLLIGMFWAISSFWWR